MLRILMNLRVLTVSRRVFFLTAILMIFISTVHSANKNTAIYSVKQDEGQNMIALTFDDGPHGTLTPQLLDVLKTMTAKVTFFVMGIKVEKHKGIIERAMTEGHEVANHVWNHPVLTKISLDAVYDQLLRTNEAIKNILNLPPKTMRPPYGNTNPKLNQYISDKGNLSVIMWSLDTQDWKRPTPQTIIDLTMKKVKSGDIILCHDIHPGTIKAMPGLVSALQGKGFTLVTVSELLKNEKKK